MYQWLWESKGSKTGYGLWQLQANLGPHPKTRKRGGHRVRPPKVDLAVAEAFVNRHQSTSNLTDYISQSSERQLWQKTCRVTGSVPWLLILWPFWYWIFNVVDERQLFIIPITMYNDKIEVIYIYILMPYSSAGYIIKYIYIIESYLPNWLEYNCDWIVPHAIINESCLNRPKPICVRYI